jgi:Synergist-CTERM protein sorting domain-containing protein
VAVTADGYTAQTSNEVTAAAPGKKSSSGGCDAGFAGLLSLLLAAPLFLRKKD